MIRQVRRLAMAIWLTSAIAGPATAAVTLQGTRVVYDASEGATTISTNNQGERPALIQVWLDDGDENAKAGSQKLPFVLSPTTRRIDAGGSQNFRLTHVAAAGPALPADRESVLYFNLLDVPPKAEGRAGSSFLQFAVRTRVKLFYRPQGLQGSLADAAAGLTWRMTSSNGEPALEVRNPSQFHITFDKITLPVGAILKPPMIAPGRPKASASRAAVPHPARFLLHGLTIMACRGSSASTSRADQLRAGNASPAAWHRIAAGTGGIVRMPGRAGRCPMVPVSRIVCCSKRGKAAEPAGYIPKSRKAVKELQPSARACRPFAASLACGVARCRQAHLLVPHPVPHPVWCSLFDRASLTPTPVVREQQGWRLNVTEPHSPSWTVLKQRHFENLDALLRGMAPVDARFAERCHP